MDKTTIFGITPSAIIKAEKHFDVLYDEDERYIAVSKETFEHDEGPDFTFKYKYVIQAEYYDGGWYYELLLVPTPESLAAKKRASVASSSCVEENELEIQDLVWYGCTVVMESDVTRGEDLDGSVIDAIASVFHCIDGLRGFFLDKPQNAIGYTGWTYLEEFINGKKAA